MIVPIISLHRAWCWPTGWAPAKTLSASSTWLEKIDLFHYWIMCAKEPYLPQLYRILSTIYGVIPICSAKFWEWMNCFLGLSVLQSPLTNKVGNCFWKWWSTLTNCADPISLVKSQIEELDRVAHHWYFIFLSAFHLYVYGLPFMWGRLYLGATTPGVRGGAVFVPSLPRRC